MATSDSKEKTKSKKKDDEVVEKKDRSAGDVVKDVALGAAGGLGGHLVHKFSPVAPAIAMYATEAGVRPGFLGQLTAPIRHRIMRHQMGVKPYPLESGSPAFGLRPSRHFWSGRLKGLDPYISIGSGDPEATVAHELGHAKNYQMLGRAAAPVAITRGLMRAAGRYVGPAAAIYSGAAEDPSYVPSLVHLGLNAPTLLEEALASIRATTHMMKRHGAMGGLRQSAHLLPAFGTYAAHALVPLGIAWAKKRRYARKQEMAREQGMKEALDMYGVTI